MSLGTRLKSERERRNWSQLFVSEKIGITNAVLSNYERDARDPDTKTLKKLADLYEVSSDYLISGNGNNIHLLNISEDEFRLLNELKKHPQLLKELLVNPEKKVKELTKLQKIKEIIEE